MAEEQKSIMQQALEQRQKDEKEQKIAKENKENFSFDPIQYFVLEDKVQKVCRIIGNPIELRTKPEDPIFILMSKILRDDTKGYLKVIWPKIKQDGTFIPDPNFILTKLFKKVNEGKWVKYDDGHIDEKGKKGYWDNYHKNKAIFKRIKGNAKEGEKYPPNFYPSGKVSFNCIDRHDDWCKDNKHCKLPTSKQSPFTFKDDNGETQTFYYTDLGVPKIVYQKIFEHYSKFGGFWEDTDTIIEKIAKDKDYDVWDKADSRQVNPDAQAIASDQPLTEEEKTYKMYNLDDIYKPTSYAKIKKYLSGLFKLCDNDLGTTFYDELLALVEKEAAEAPQKEDDSENASDIDYNGQNYEAEEGNTPTHTEDYAPIERESKKERETASTTEFSDEDFEKNFPHWNDLSEEDKGKMKKAILSITNGIPKYAQDVEVYYCSDKTCNYPGTSTRSIYPGDVLKCFICGKS